MATTLTDAFTAIDDYMSNNGKGQTYLAKKFIDIFENKDSPLNMKDGPLKDLSNKITKMGATFNTLDTSLNSFNMKVRILMSALKPTNFRLLSSASEKLTKKIEAYEKAFKVPTIRSTNTSGPSMMFNKKMENALIHIQTNTILSRNILAGIHKTLLDNNKEKILGNNTNANVSNSASGNVYNYYNSGSEDKTTGSIGIIGKLLGVAGVLAGIGFLSKILDNSPIGKVIKNMAKQLGQEAWDNTKPVLLSIWDNIKTGLLVLAKGVKDFFLSTFDFYNIKNKIGPEYEGLAVILTKSIYYGTKSLLLKVGNFFSFGLLGKGLNIIKSFTITPLQKLSTKIGEGISRLGTSLLKPFNMVSKFFSTNGIFKTLEELPNLLSKGVFGKTSAGFGGLGKGILKMFSAFGLKFGGTLLKNIGKRIPFVGLAISLYDSWQRFEKGDITGGIISLGSGIASTFPIAGTAISIGLDILNALLDNSSQSSGKSKMKVIGDFFGISDFISNSVNGVRNFVSGMFEWVNNIWKNITDFWEKGKEKINNIFNNDTVYSKLYDRLSTNKFYTPNFAPPSNDEYKKAYEMYKNTKRTNLEDGEVIIPDKKDHITFAKGGGPFDVALKDMSKKIDMIIDVLSSGFSGLASVTSQGNGMVAQAVLNSASAANKQPVVIGGRNPIHKHRINTGNHIEFVG